MNRIYLVSINVYANVNVKYRLVQHHNFYVKKPLSATGHIAGGLGVLLRRQLDGVSMDDDTLLFNVRFWLDILFAGEQ